MTNRESRLDRAPPRLVLRLNCQRGLQAFCVGLPVYPNVRREQLPSPDDRACERVAEIQF